MRRAHCLDALRLLASLTLAIGHLTTAPLVPAWMSSLLLGGLSSTTFFIISGFVAVVSSRFWELPLGAILQQRMMRLLPAHWVGFLIVLPASLLGASRLSTHELWVTLAWWLPGMQNFAPEQAFSRAFNPPAWAVTPLLIGGIVLVALRALEVRRWGAQALVGLFCLTVLMRMGIDLLSLPPENDAQQMLRHSALFPRLLEILAGAWAGVLWSSEGGDELRRWLKREGTLITALFVVLTLLVTAGELGGKEAIFLYTHGVYLPLGLLLVTAAYANEARLDRICAHPWIVHGGKISTYTWMTRIPREGCDPQKRIQGWNVVGRAERILSCVADASSDDRSGQYLRKGYSIPKVSWTADSGKPGSRCRAESLRICSISRKEKSSISER